MTSYERWKYCGYPVKSNKTGRCGKVAEYESEGGTIRFLCHHHMMVRQKEIEEYREAQEIAEQQKRDARNKRRRELRQLRKDPEYMI